MLSSEGQGADWAVCGNKEGNKPDQSKATQTTAYRMHLNVGAYEQKTKDVCQQCECKSFYHASIYSAVLAVLTGFRSDGPKS